MKFDQQHGRRGGRYLTATAVLLGVAGAGALGVGLAAQRSAPRPPVSAGILRGPDPSESARAGSAATSAKLRGPILARSLPVRLDIPSISVHSALMQLGLNADRSVQVPPLTRNAPAGWYRYSPTPGQLGPSIILGHVDSARYGPAIFFNLGALRPGDTVWVTRADGSVAVFRVDRVVEYAKARFPAFEVYGNTDNAALRLITCGGRFNLSAHSYEDNIVAYASLVSSH